MNNSLKLGNKTRKLLTQNLSESLGKVPPQAIDLEEAVLGALLIESNTIHEVVGDLFPEVMYKDSHRQIVKAILDLYNEAKNIDLLTVTDRLRKNETLEMAGGAYYITELTSKVNSSAHIKDHILVIKEKWLAREIIRISTEFHQKAYENKNDIFDELNNVQSAYLDLSEQLNGARSLTMKQAAFETLKKLETARVEKKKFGMNTGFVDIDRTCGGWRDGNLIIIAARPGMGKTALLLGLARYAATSKRCLAFSLEMTREEFINRMICSLAEVEFNKFGDPKKFYPDEWKRVLTATEVVSNLNLQIEEEGGLSYQEIRAKAIMHKQKYGLDILFVDYLQLMKMPDAPTKNNSVEIITMALKNLAKELNVPVILLSQLSRAVESRGGNKRPQLSDLRDSGAIEQDADMVIFIYRSEYYEIPPADENGNPLQEGTTELIFAKNRGGKIGKIYLIFKGEHVSFYDYVDISSGEFQEFPESPDWYQK